MNDKANNEIDNLTMPPLGLKVLVYKSVRVFQWHFLQREYKA